MDIYHNFQLKKVDSSSDEYALVLHLDGDDTEFADEFGAPARTRKDLVKSAKQFINTRYPNLKVTMIKIVIGGMAITTIPIAFSAPETASAQEVTQITETVQTDNPFYQVQKGDTLWLIANKFHTSVQDLKTANNLSSDILQLNQQLIIPQGFHTVTKGDTLYSIGKRYGVSTGAIKKANQLKSDAIQLNQRLTIPKIPTENQQIAPAAGQTSSYTVKAGDSLFLIAQKFNTTVAAIKAANHFTSDSLKIGQIINIPLTGEIGQTTPPARDENKPSNAYTVAPGDTLWGIANKFGIAVNDIKKANHLTSDSLKVGQRLILTEGTSSQPNSNTKTSYTVVSGDTLYSIAKKHGIAVERVQII